MKAALPENQPIHLHFQRRYPRRFARFSFSSDFHTTSASCSRSSLEIGGTLHWHKENGSRIREERPTRWLQLSKSLTRPCERFMKVEAIPYVHLAGVDSLWDDEEDVLTRLDL